MTRCRHLALAGALLLAHAVPTAAQDRSVVFLHGLFADSRTWDAAAARLQGQLALQPYVPTTDEGAPYETQAAQVQGALGWLDGSAIAIGHSNGGLVARQWSQSHPLSGIVTVGTPHLGAPLLANFGSYANFGYTLRDAIWAVFDEFNFSCCDWRWILTQIAQQMIDAAGIFDLSMGQLILNLGLNVAHPVLPQMVPGSDYLQSINSPGNLAREGAAVPARVGIVSVAHNFYWGGPIRAALPDHADYLAAIRDVARDILNYFAWALWTTAPFEDWQAWSLAGAMWNASYYLAVMDEWWCQAVSWPGFGLCWENDTIVPTYSQNYGQLGAAVGVMLDGPAHTQQTAQSDAFLSWALTAFMGVTGRAASPPPPPPPPPPSGSAGDTLGAETGLYRGDYLTSSDGRYRLEYQWDGNLVLYDEHGNALWWSGTWGAPGAAWMRADGGFIIYNGSNEPMWDSGTRGELGNWYLRLENNGTFVIYMPDGTPVWSN
jgi:pimeloyl-ACP methyl ester carboxylesterase